VWRSSGQEEEEDNEEESVRYSPTTNQFRCVEGRTDEYGNRASVIFLLGVSDRWVIQFSSVRNHSVVFMGPKCVRGKYRSCFAALIVTRLSQVSFFFWLNNAVSEPAGRLDLRMEFDPFAKNCCLHKKGSP